MGIVLFIFVLSLTSVLFNIASIFFMLPAGNYKRNIKSIRRKKRKKTVKTIISKVIRLDTAYRDKLLALFSRVGIAQSPEEYFADGIAQTLKVLICFPVFILIGLPIGAIFTVLLAAAVFFKKIKYAEEKVRDINEEIISELPMFIRNFSYSLEFTRDVVAIIDSYRTVAGKHLKAELDILVTEMKTGSYEDAIQRFDKRLNIDAVTSFATGLIGIGRGIDYKTYFFLLEENMRILARENLKRKVSKRPGKLQKAILGMVGAIAFMFIIPMMIQMKDSLNIFN